MVVVKEDNYKRVYVENGSYVYPKNIQKYVASEASIIFQKHGNHGIERRDRERTDDGSSTLSSGFLISTIERKGKKIER